MKSESVSPVSTPRMTGDQIHPFGSREEAGRQLAGRLAGFTGRRDAVVLALPNGGVPVAAEVARSLRIPFDVLLVGAITAPGCGHRQVGAVTGGGVRTLNCAMIDRLQLSDADIHAAILRKSLQLARRERLYRGTHPSLDVADRLVILVDDGSTSCATIRNAIHLLRRQHAEKVIVALPAPCHNAACDLRMEADDVVTLMEPVSRIPAAKCFEHSPRTSASLIRRLLHRVDRSISGMSGNAAPECT